MKKRDFSKKTPTLLLLGFILSTLLACGGGGGSSSSGAPGSSSSSSGGNSSSGSSCSENCVRINEAVSSNFTFEDAFNKKPDWFELYNYGNRQLDLSDWSVTDDADIPDKWVFPANTLLTSNRYLLVWASDENTLVDGELHTNFKISSEGETLYLFNPRGELVSSLEVSGLRAGTSVGVSRSGASPRYFAGPTPGSLNANNDYGGVVLAQPVFSHEGGINSPASVSLSGAGDEQQIRYTTDGSVPTQNSALYSSSITINRNMAIRAAIFTGDYLPGKPASRTFLPDAQHDIAVVTLVTEPDNFFHNDTGIYVYGDSYESWEPYYGANFWEDWEKNIHFSLYENNGDFGLALDAGVKIFGGWSRMHAQRSLSIFARQRYGTEPIEYPLFPSRNYSEFEALVLRNSGNDWMSTMLRDAALTSLVADTAVDMQAFRPVATYLNGEYWGMYNMREKINEHYLASLHNLDSDDITLLERNAEIIFGDNSEYIALVDFIADNDLSIQSNYDYVAERIDIDNLIAYFASNVYFNNQDWPGNNNKFWKSINGKWRWILFDTDFGFGIWNVEDYYDNTLAFALEQYGPNWPNPPWSTLMYRKLLDNTGFRNQLINFFADQFNGRFKASHVIAHINSLADVIASEMPQHFQRWEDNNGASWQGQLENMRTFASNRVYYLNNHISSEFGLNGRYQLTLQINNPAAGSVQLNSLTIAQAEWQGDYYRSVPIQLQAIPAEGYRFVGWQGDTSSTNTEISLNANSATQIQAVFEAL